MPTVQQSCFFTLLTIDGGERTHNNMIAKVFRSRIELRLKNEKKNFEFNAGGE